MLTRKISSEFIKTVPVGGAATSAVKEYVQKERAIEKALEARLPSSLLFIRKMKWLISESGTTIINALGTGLVAPIFIAYNPLSKTDEDTKKYTALRQPISAFLAVVTQVGLSLPLDKLMFRMSNDGGYSHQPLLNQTILQDEKYLLKQFKARYKGETDKQIADRVDLYRNEQYSKAIDSLKTHNDLIIDGKPVPKDRFKTLLSNVLKDVRTQIEGRIRSIQEKDIDFRTQRIKFVSENSDEIKKIMEEILSECQKGSDYAKVKTVIENLILKYKDENAAPELLNILDEFKTRDNVLLFEHRAKSHLRRLNQMEPGHTLEAIRERVIKEYDVYQVMLKEDSKLISNMLDQLNKGEDVQKVIQKFSNIKSTDLFYKTIKGWSAMVKDRLKKSQAKTGLLINLIMLPFTCSLLNWVYPKLMDMFFPELSAKKTKVKNGGVK